VGARARRGPAGTGIPDVNAALSTRDRGIIAMLVFFSLFNVTLDLYYVWNASRLEAMVTTDVLARLWAFYAAADRFWVVAPWSFAQEWLNVFATTAVNVWLVWAIVKRRPYRHALQLTLGSYLTYSVILYFLAAHVSGYAGMREVTVPWLAFFYAVTLPWGLGHAYMAWDSYTAITDRFRRP
jgi:hypothetical protein